MSRYSLMGFAVLALAAPVSAQPEPAAPAQPPPVADVAQQAQTAEEAPGEERRLTFGAETDATSRYVWRGLAFSDGAVQQSSLWASTRGYTFTIWSNFVTGKGADNGRMNEVDYTVCYSREMKGWTFEPSVNLYTYPNSDTKSTAELSLKFSRPFGEYSLFTAQTVDFLEGKGAYYGEIGASREWSLNKQLAFEAAVNVGWASSKFNDFNAGVSAGGAHVLGGQLSWTYTKNGFYARPHIGVTTLLNSRVRNAVEDGTILFGGLALGKEF